MLDFECFGNGTTGCIIGSGEAVVEDLEAVKRLNADVDGETLDCNMPSSSSCDCLLEVGDVV